MYHYQLRLKKTINNYKRPSEHAQDVFCEINCHILKNKLINFINMFFSNVNVI